MQERVVVAKCIDWSTPPDKRILLGICHVNLMLVPQVRHPSSLATSLLRRNPKSK